MRATLAVISIQLLMVIFSCDNKDTGYENTVNTVNLMQKDPHTSSNYQEINIEHLSLDLKVNFDEKIVQGKATYSLNRIVPTNQFIVDFRSLEILSVHVDSTQIKDYVIEKGQSELGKSLRIPVTDSTKNISIHYKTMPDSEALQWLEPKQTFGQASPFLFTQSQAVLCRSWIPIQDTPASRFTYDARVEVPSGMLALMSAENPQKVDTSGVYLFSMDQPVPSYLMALAVGDISFRPLDERSGVYAEPSIIDTAAYEFADLPKMMTSAEELFGAYEWGRYDVIVLPKSFPFGGMENPRLTFATPTILAGDRSLTSLIAHELAHSWSGNLVTNQSWEELWLNEGFTVYFEYRIMEALYGIAYADMLRDQSYFDLQQELKSLEANNKAEDTKLKLELNGRDPDEGMTSVAYDKGYFFLEQLEQVVGRKQFDEFLESYFKAFKFQSINTEKFVIYLQQQLGNSLSDNKLSELIDDWIYSPALPAYFSHAKSTAFQQVEQELLNWTKTSSFDSSVVEKWSSHEWVYALENLPDSISYQDLNSLEESYKFNTTGNAEIKFVWFKRCIEKDYRPAYSALEKFLITTGRRKFIQPLYAELIKQNEKLARRIYAKARDGYHYVSYNSIDKLFEEI